MPGSTAGVPFPRFPTQRERHPLDDRLRLRLLHLGGVQLTPAWNQRHRRESCWRLYCNLDDGAVLHLADGPFPLRARHLVLIPPSLEWQGGSRDGVRHLVAHLDLSGPAARALAAAITAPVAVPPGRGPGAGLHREFRRLAEELEMGGGVDALHLCRGHALAWQALVAACAHLPAAVRARLAPPPADPAVAAVQAWIEAHLAEPLPVAALARRAGCSPQHLARRWRAATGLSPARWVQQRRLAHAGDLLAADGAGIEAVAAACGYADRHHFTRAFTRCFGVGPASFRRRR